MSKNPSDPFFKGRFRDGVNFIGWTSWFVGKYLKLSARAPPSADGELEPAAECSGLSTLNIDPIDLETLPMTGTLYGAKCNSVPALFATISNLFFA